MGVCEGACWEWRGNEQHLLQFHTAPTKVSLCISTAAAVPVEPTGAPTASVMTVEPTGVPGTPEPTEAPVTSEPTMIDGGTDQPTDAAEPPVAEPPSSASKMAAVTAAVAVVVAAPLLL